MRHGMNKRGIGMGRWALGLSAAALLLGAGSASALVQEGRGEGARVQSRQSMVITQRDADGSVYRVELTDGVLSAFINNEPVPAERIVREGDEVSLRDARGRELARFTVSFPRVDAERAVVRAPAAPSPRARGGEAREPIAWVLGAEPAAPMAVMGVYTADVTAEESQVRGLPAGSVRVLRVQPGWPAEASGIRADDVIVRLNDDAPGGAEGLRAVLRERQPGDEIRLRVLRGDEAKDVTVRLRKYEMAAFDALAARDANEERMIEIQLDAFQDGYARAQELSQRARADAERWAEHSRERAERARQRAEELGRLLEHRVFDPDLQRELRRQLDETARLRGDALIFRPATPPTPPQPAVVPSPEVRTRLDAMESRLEMLERRMESMVDRMERLLQRLETR